MTCCFRITDYLHLLISNFQNSVLTCKYRARPHYRGLHVNGSSKLKMQIYSEALALFDVSEPSSL